MPAAPHAVASGGNLTLTDSNGVLTLAADYMSLANSLPMSANISLALATPGNALTLTYGSGLTLSNGAISVDTSTIESRSWQAPLSSPPVASRR